MILVNFPTQISNCDSHSPVLLGLFIHSDASTCSIVAFPLLGNSDHVLVSVCIDSKEDAHFHGTAYNYSCAD